MLYFIVISMLLITLHAKDNSTLYLVRLSNAPQTHGARCLDGSSPTYYHRAGVGSGANSFFIFFEGGGWCAPINHGEGRFCNERAHTFLGSTINDSQTMDRGEGLWALSASYKRNPRFYNWNVGWLRYCDGSSFTSYHQQQVNVSGDLLWYRGRNILQAQLDHLKDNKGLDKAKEVIIMGCSAGGLAAYIHCQAITDWIHATISKSVRVVCWPDAGFFIDTLSVTHSGTIDVFFHDVFTGFNSTGSVSPGCLTAFPPHLHYKCFFAQHALTFTKTPVFAWQSGYDSWQMKAEWFSIGNRPCGSTSCPYYKCTKDLSACNTTEMEAVQGFHQKMLNIMKQRLFNPKTPHGGFVTSCLAHCQSDGATRNATLYGGLNGVEAFAAWYDGKLVAKIPDLPWPHGNCPK